MRLASGALTGAAVGGQVGGPAGAAIGAVVGGLFELESATSELALAQSQAANSKFFNILANLDIGDVNFDRTVGSLVKSLEKADKAAEKIAGTDPTSVKSTNRGLGLLAAFGPLLGGAIEESQQKNINIGTSLKQSFSTFTGTVGNILGGDLPAEAVIKASQATAESSLLEKEKLTAKDKEAINTELRRVATQATSNAPAGGALAAFNEQVKVGTNLFNLKNKTDASVVNAIRKQLGNLDRENTIRDDLNQALLNSSKSLLDFNNSLLKIGDTVAASSEKFSARQAGIGGALTVAGGGIGQAGGRLGRVNFKQGGAASRNRLRAASSAGIISSGEATTLSNTLDAGATLDRVFDSIVSDAINANRFEDDPGGLGQAIAAEIQKVLGGSRGGTELLSTLDKTFKTLEEQSDPKKIESQFATGALRKSILGGAVKTARTQAKNINKELDTQGKELSKTVETFNNLLRKQNNSLATVNRQRLSNEEALAELGPDFILSQSLRKTGGGVGAVSKLGDLRNQLAQREQLRQSGSLVNPEARQRNQQGIENLRNAINSLENAVQDEKLAIQKNIQITNTLIQTEKDVVLSAQKTAEDFARLDIKGLVGLGPGAKAGARILGGRQVAPGQLGGGIDLLRQLQTLLAPALGDEQRQRADKGLGQAIGRAVLNAPFNRAVISAAEAAGATPEQIKALKDAIVKGRTDKQTLLLEQQANNFKQQLAVSREELITANAILEAVRELANIPGGPQGNIGVINNLLREPAKKAIEQPQPRDPRVGFTGGTLQDALTRNKREFELKRQDIRESPLGGEQRREAISDLKKAFIEAQRTLRIDSNIPETIGVSVAGFDVNVNINGVQGLLEGSLKMFVENTVANAIQKMLPTNPVTGEGGEPIGPAMGGPLGTNVGSIV